MKRLLYLFIFLILASFSFASTQIKIGTLQYAFEKNTNPAQLGAAAIARLSSADEYNICVRFPGYKSYWAIDGSGGSFHGWSGSYNREAGIITVDSPKGYQYIFEDTSAADPNTLVGNPIRLKEVINPDNLAEDNYSYDTNGKLEIITDGDATNAPFLLFNYDTTGEIIESADAVDPSVSSASFNYSRSYDLNYDEDGRVVSVTNSALGCGCSSGGGDWLTDVYDANDLVVAQDANSARVYNYTYYADQSLCEKLTGSNETIVRHEYEDLGNDSKKEKIYKYTQNGDYRYSELLYDNDELKEKRVFKELRNDSTDPNTFDTAYYSESYLYETGKAITIPHGASVDGTGERIEETYDSQNRLVSTKEYSSGSVYRTTNTTNYSGDNVNYEKDLRDAQTSYEYVTGSNLLYKKTMPSDTNSQQTYYLYSYDSKSRLITEEFKLDDPALADPNDIAIHSKHFEYDSFGNICKEYSNSITDRSNPDSVVVEYVYNAFGDLVWHIDASGIVKGRVYNAGGQLTDEFLLAGGKTAFDSITNPLDCNYSSMLLISQTRYQYSSVNGKKEFIETAIAQDAFTFDNPASWSVTKFVYDGFGNRIEAIRDFGGENLSTTYQYNLQNELKTTTDPTGKTTTKIRDSRGLVVQLIVSDGTNSITTENIYDNRGNLVETLVEDELTKSYEYDEFGRTERVYFGETDPNILPTVKTQFVEYDYDGDTDDIKIETIWNIDPNNFSRAITKQEKFYNDLGQLICKRGFNNPSSEDALKDRFTFYRYDATGNLSVTAQLGDGFSFDDEYFLIELRKYDANGNLAAIIKGGCPELGDDYFDSLSQPIYENVFGFSLSDTQDFILARDSLVDFQKYAYVNGRLENVSVYTGIIDGELSFSQILEREYDSVGRLTKQTDSSGNFKTFSYDSRGKQIEETLWQGVNVLDPEASGFTPYSLTKSLVLFDNLGRPKRRAILADPSSTVSIENVDLDSDRVTDYIYNSQGQLYQEQKYFFGDGTSRNKRNHLQRFWQACAS